MTEEQVLGVLKRVQDPDLRKDIVSLGFIRNLKIDSGKVSFDLNLTTPACPVKDQMRDEAVALVKGLARRRKRRNQNDQRSAAGAATRQDSAFRAFAISSRSAAAKAESANPRLR